MPIGGDRTDKVRSFAELLSAFENHGRDPDILALLHTLFNGVAKDLITSSTDAEAIPVTRSALVALVTADVDGETRTLAAPSFVGQEITLYFKTDGGDVVITSTPIGASADNTITFDDEGQTVTLLAIESGATIIWSVLTDPSVTVSSV